MKIILLQDVRGVGRQYDVKDIPNGYARNFLIPRGLAKVASKEALKEVEFQKESWEKQTELLREKLKEVQDKLDKNPPILKLKVGEEDKAFGSITKKDIEDKLGVKVNLVRSIKTLGEHEVEIDFDRGIVGKVKLKVEKE